MALVDYSDSDDASESEQASAPKSSNTSKPSFHKVVDRSNPGKIRVSLPQAVLKEDDHRDEPPAKRAKTGGGAFSGFNSFLPAPKRADQTTATATTSSSKKAGLVPGVSLKTGAAPGFSRDPEPEREYTSQDVDALPAEWSGLGLPPPKTTSLDQKPAEEVKLVDKPLMFRPLSVSRKPVKKKKQTTYFSTATASSHATPSTPDPKTDKPTQKAKVSLFSMSTEAEKPSVSLSSGEYQPMLHESVNGNEEEDEEAEGNSFGLDPSYEDYTPTTTRMAPPAVPTPPVSQSLDEIAGDLNLTESQRRQLFGRQKGGRMQSATKVINFNTDQEYLHNEELRAAGEQVTHNPVRSIAPGKHSLKQLVNAAQSQKDALEESFAKGKSNRAEASSRYGW